MYKKYIFQEGKVAAEVAIIKPESGPEEYNVAFHITDVTLTFTEQLSALDAAMHDFTSSVDGVLVVFRRYFVSDAANQQPLVQESALKSTGAVSIVQQPPLDGSKIALWCVAFTGVTGEQKGNMFVVNHGEFHHYWIGNLSLPEGDSFHQTSKLLKGYADELQSNGMTLHDNCVRTWFFVQNVDVNYKGVVDARRELFYDYNLTKNTHYIASTGICGCDGNPKSVVKLDAYAIKGLQPGQMKYLYAKDYLNPTYEYNVTFERGVTVSFAYRKHLFLSGTASIDNKGNVVYPGDIRKQTERMWLNSDMLLREGGASIDKDSQIMLVYLRDTADYAVVKQKYDERFPNVPKMILLAPVCRPGWLIEMETVATTLQKSEYKPF